ncbi:hypothetical protein niasHT_039168 [Heterodera trifolii]|uniref:Glutathione synthetase n=1 Tax=Heterodera trifolii TaxID=157864 RepID=A0ABD2I7I0_9BILA
MFISKNLLFVFFVSALQFHSDANPNVSIRNPAVEGVKSSDQLATLVQAAVDVAHEVGLIKRLTDDDSRKRRTSDVASIQPISLFPSPFPRSAYQQAMDVHTGMQKLYFLVSCDFDFLVEATEGMDKSNNLYGRMIEMMKEIHREGQRQPYTLFLTRSDYMVDSTTDERDGQQRFGLKQVEMNIGSVVGSAMGPRTAEMHRRMLQRMRMDASNVPENRAFNTLARGLFQAWLRFGDPNAVVVFAVLQGSMHRFDERAVEYELQRISDWQVKVVRLSSKEAYAKLQLDPNDFTLRLTADGRAVAVVYSRSGPLPEWTEEEWEARKRIERSTAIKTSTVFSALSSSKRVQQLLAQPGMIERFMPEPKDRQMVEAIRQTFVGLWGLENEDKPTQQLIQLAIDNPHLYVLKPQNEGGGHNYFDDELKQKLLQFTREERAAHTLMQRIWPVTAKNFMVRPMEEAVLDDTVVELGMFGYLLGDKRDKSIVHNKQHGYLVRTKPASSAEGGISAGGVYDSLNLF